jgi:putative ABC transport system substrate-binding protein
MDRRRAVAIVVAGVLAPALRAQPVPRRKLGILGIGDAEGFMGGRRRSFLAELARLGYVAGRTLEVEERFEKESPEKLAENARALVAAKVDAIITEGTPATLAAQAATRSIPIVTNVADPVLSGFAKEVRRPGGNITGLSQNRGALAGKQIELLRLLRPHATTIAIVYEEPFPGVETLVRPVERAARAASIAAHLISYRSGEFSRVLEELKRLRIDAVVDIGVSDRDRPGLVRANVAVGAGNEEEVVAHTALFSVENDSREDYLAAAAALDRVFRGANPADMPFIEPLRYRVAVNLEVAQRLGISVSPEVLLRADRVIEMSRR